MFSLICLAHSRKYCNVFCFIILIWKIRREEDHLEDLGIDARIMNVKEVG